MVLSLEMRATRRPKLGLVEIRVYVTQAEKSMVIKAARSLNQSTSGFAADQIIKGAKSVLSQQASQSSPR
jgi:uncharacterized protein (DUF1778 family)